MKHSARRHITCRGFSLAEFCVVLLLLGLCGAVLLGVMAGVRRLIHAPVLLIEGRQWAVAPSFAAMPSALSFHAIFSERLAEARAVYVFGGDAVAGSKIEVCPPLGLMGRPEFDGFPQGLPLDGASFAHAYVDRLGPVDQEAGRADFSVLCVGLREERLVVTCFVQVRSRPTSSEFGPMVCRDVRLWDHREGVNGYAFAERGTMTSLPFVGAVHSLYTAPGAQDEEAPVTIVFPDPWLYLGARGDSGEAAPASRFMYLAGVSP